MVLWTSRACLVPEAKRVSDSLGVGLLIVVLCYGYVNAGNWTLVLFKSNKRMLLDMSFMSNSSETALVIFILNSVVYIWR